KVSISLWVKLTESSLGTIILELGNTASSATNNWFSLIVGSTRNFFFRAKGNTASNYLDINDWYHIVVTADLSQAGFNEQTFYINGNFIQSTVEQGIDQTGDFANGILHIGQRNGTTQGFKGLI